MSGSYSMDPTFRISNCELGRRSPVVTRSMGNTSKNDILAKVFCLSPKEILRPNYFESELSEDEQIQERKGRRQKLVKRRRSVSAICRHKKEPIKSTDINDYKNPLNTPKKLLERRYTLDAVLSDHKELCFSNGMGNFHLYNTNYADFPIKNNQIIPLQTQDEVIEMRCALSGSNRENIKDKLDIDTNQTNSHRSRARKRKPDKVKIINNALSPKVNQHSQSNKIEIITTKQEISRTTNKEDSSESSTKRNSDRVKDIINNSKSRNSIQTKIDNEDTGIVPKSSLKCSLKLECMENLSKRRRSKTPNKYCCDTNKNDRRKVPQSTGRRKSLIETNKKIDIEQIYIDQVQKSIDMSEAGPKTPNKLKPNKVIDTTNTLNSEMKSSRSNLLLKSKVDIVKEKLNKSKEHSNPSKEHSNPRKEHSSPRKEHSNPRDVDYVKCKIENKQGLDRIDKKPSECGRKNKKEKVKKTPMALKEESGHTYNVSKPTEKLRSPGLNKGVVEEKLKESNSMKDVSKNNRADCRSKHHHQSRSEHKDYMATPTKRDREQTKSFKNHSEERVVPKDNKHASREKENERKDKNKNTKHSDHSNSRKEDEHKRSERTKHRSSSTSKSRDVMKNIGEVQSELKDTNKNVEKNEVERSYNKRGNEENMNKNKNAINKEISDSMKPNSSTPDIIKIKEKSVSDRTRYKCSENPNKKIEVESKRTMDMATDTTDYLPELIPINNVEFAFTNNTNNSTSQSLPTLKYKQGVNNQGDIQIKVITPYTESLRNLPHDLKISLTPRYPNANQHQPEPMSKIVQTSVKYPGTNQIVRTEKPAEYPPMPHTVADQIGNALKPRRHSYSADMNIQPHLPQHLESKSPQMKPLIEEPKQLPVCPLLNQSNRKPASNKQLTYLDRDPRMIAKVRRSSKPAPEEAAQENIMRGVSTSQNLADVPVAAPQKDAPSIRNTFTVNEWEFARKFCENIQNYMERTPEELLASMFETSNLDNDSTEDLIQILADNAPVETLTDAIPSVVAGETSAVDDNCLVPTNVEPPAVVHPRNTEVWFDVRVPRGNTVLEQTVEVRDTSMEVTKDTNNASASNTVAINDDVFLEEVDEREDSKVDVKDFKFDLAEFQQKYMPTTSRTKLKQLIQIFREEDFQCYQKVMEKLSAATELPVKEIITIDDEDGATSGEGNSVPEPDNAATIISAKRAVSVGANVSPSKKLKVNTVTTSTNTQTNPNQDKDLNQNYIPGERSVIVQQKNNESHTAPPPPPAPCVIEDISSEEDTTSRTFSELSEPPQQPDAYMNVNKSTGNIIYAKAMPSQPPPPMPSCSQTPPHLPFYKPRANEKPTTVLDNVVTEPFPTTPEMLSPTSPIAHTPLSAVTPAKPDVSWRSWMSDERYKNFFGMNMSPTSRDQSLETINSIGSNYSPKFILDNNMVDVKLDTKWFRITKRLYDRIPKGKMCYIKDTNTFVRYFDDAQTQKFITNLDMYINNPLTTDLLKQIKGRKQNNAGLDTYVGPLESSINNEVFHVAKNVTFCPNDKINDPEMYVHEVQKVQKYLPIDFYAFYKFVTGYQIINNHAPISFQTFLIMHNTNGMRKLFNKYVRSLIEGWIVV